MIIECFSESYGSFGGNGIFGFPCDLLTVRLGDYGTAFDTIRLVVFMRKNPADVWPSEAEKVRECEETVLKQLPRVRVDRQGRRIKIEFFCEQFWEREDHPLNRSAEKCNAAGPAILSALGLLTRRVKRSDDFDLGRFLSDAETILATKFDSISAWEEIGEQAFQKQQALDAEDPWRSLEINWKKFHPSVRTILDEPFYWDSADDMAPHGNDTGADLLDDFLAWEKRNKANSPLLFLEGELKKWDVAPIDWAITDEKAVRALHTDDWAELTLCNEAAIALAFAVLKTRGSCPPDLVHMALASITRTGITIKDSSLSEDLKAQWDIALARMKHKLASLPPQTG